MKSTRSTRDRSGSSLVEAEILTKTSALYGYRRFLYTAVLFCSVIATHAQSRLTLAWDRNSETNIAGYKLYRGTVPSVYTNVVNVGNVTTASVSNLAAGVTHRFAVTAYNTAGMESDYSSEITFTTTNIVTPNLPPTLAGLASLTINEDAGTQTVLLTGISSGGENQTLTVTAAATPQSLISSVGAAYTSPSATGTVSFVTAPNAWGTGVVNVTVSDGLAQTVRSFAVTVNPVDDAPTISNIADRTIDQNTATGPIGFTIGDVETAAGSLALSASSSNPTLVPNQNIIFGGSGSSRTVNVTPATSQTGTATINITVSDGARTATDSWVLTVRPTATTNTPPSISAVRNTTIFSGGTSLPLRFSVSDTETAPEALQVSAASSNPSLIPDGNIAFQGSGSGRTLTVTANNGIGNAVITLSVNDGSGNTRSTNFGVSVVARPAQLVSLPLEAESGSLVAPMQRSTNAGVVYIGTTSSQQGTATFQFSVPVAGNYIIWARHLSVDSGRDSFFVAMDGSEVPYHTALETWSSNWQWTRVNVGTSLGTASDEPRVFNLSVGTHTLVFRGREVNCFLDQFIICNDLDFVPGMNTAPTISSIPDQTIAVNTATGNLPLTIGDAESNPADLTLSGTSSNPTLVPQGNIVFGGSGSSRTVNVTPAANQSGTATISITVSDGSRTATDSWVLTVSAATNTPPTISSLGPRTIDEDTGTGSIPFTVFDAETPGSLVISTTSSNPSLVSTANMTIGGSGTNRTLAVTPALNQSGSATITVSVSDGQLSASSSFVLIVNALNDAPGLTSLGSRRISVNSTTGPIGFTIGDVETPAANLTLSGTSSNPTLVPQANIVFGGSGSNRTVQVTPATDQLGTSMITVWVSDGALAASRTFELTVTETNALPTMAPLANASVPVKTVSALPSIAIADADSTNLIVTGRSSNASVLPDGNIFIGTSGLSRTLSVRPQRAGTTTVTLTVSDGFGQSSQSFLLTATNRFKLRPSDLATSSSGAFTVVWDSSPGDTYRVMANSDLTYTNWVAVSGTLTAVSETTWWTDHNAASRRACFYLIELISSE